MSTFAITVYCLVFWLSGYGIGKLRERIRWLRALKEERPIIIGGYEWFVDLKWTESGKAKLKAQVAADEFDTSPDSLKLPLIVP